MLQFLADNIDQLDLALDQLAVKDRNFDRFALMLVDNVVELTLHRYAQDRASENEFWGKAGKQKHDPRIINKALKQAFDNKAKAARDLGFFDNTLCDSLLYMHGFRNTAYHQGLRHEGILHSIAVFYFINACEVLQKYEPRFWGWSSRDIYSHRARKYIGDIKMLDHKQVFHSAYERLLEVANSLEYDLVADLARDMASTIDEVDEMLSFLSTNAPDKPSRDEVIIDVQAWPFAFTDKAKAFASQNGCTEKYVGPYIEWISKNYKWPITVDPVESWRKRQESLQQEESLHMALKRYCDFMSQTRSLRSQIEETANQLDAHIQNLIDESRCK